MHSWEKNWQDYYAILGITRNATSQEIKKAYKEKSKKYHPDNCISLSEEEKIKAQKEFEKIILAYETLSNEKEKNLYDSVYDQKKEESSTQKNENSSFEEESNFDEAMKGYSEATKKATNKIVLRQLIREELEKANILIEQKKEILQEVFLEKIDSEEFYLNIQSLVEVVYSYINSLEKLCFKAYENQLYSEIESLEKMIKFLEKQFQNLPENRDEAILYVKNETLKDDFPTKYKKLEEECLDLIAKINDFLLECYNGTMTPTNFYQDLNLIKVEIQHKIDYLEMLKNVFFQMEETENIALISGLIAKLRCRINIVPTSLEEARKQGKIEEKLKEFANLNLKINEEATKILRIIGLITKYPKSGLCEFLYNAATNLSVDIDKLYLEAYELKSRFLQSSTYASDIQKINNMVKETYQAASGLNAKIDFFVKNNQFEAILEEYKLANINQVLFMNFYNFF